MQSPVVRPDERPERPRPAKRRPQTAPTLPGWLVCDLFWGWFTHYLLSLFQVGIFFQIGKPFVCCWKKSCGSWFGLIHLKYLCGSELMNNSAGLYLPALSWNFSYTFEHCITKAFYRKSSLNLLLAISPTFVKYLVWISFKGSPFRGPLRKEHPHSWLWQVHMQDSSLVIFFIFDHCI